MKELFSLIYLLTISIFGVSALEVILDINFQQKKNCLETIQSHVTFANGDPYNMMCEKQCTYNQPDNDNKMATLNVIDVLGVTFTYSLASFTEPYSYIEVDVSYILSSGPSTTSHLTLDINGLVQNNNLGDTVSSPMYDDPSVVNCGSTLRTIYSGSCTLNQQLSAGTDLVVNLGSSYSGQYLRSIRISKNCTPNCNTCSSSISCNSCLSNFQKYTFSGGPTVCEQVGVCTAVANCFSCAINNSQVVCLTCQQGFTLNSSSTCVANTPAPASPCASNQYNQNGVCTPYSSIGYYQNRQSGAFTLITADQTNVQTTYKCPANTLAIVLSQGNYETYQCQCMFTNCISCSSISSCDICTTGMYFNSTTSTCSQATFSQTTYTLSTSVTSTGYLLKLIFSNTLISTTLDITKLLVTISNFSDFTYTYSGVQGDKTLTYAITCNSNVKSQKITVTINDNTFLSQNLISSNTQTSTLNAFIEMPSSEIKASQNFHDIGVVFAKIFAILFIIMAFFGRFKILVNTIDIIGMLYYLLLIDVRYPINIAQLPDILQKFQMSFFPNFFSGIVDSSYGQYAPPQLANQPFNSYFLISSGTIISFFILVIGVYFIVKIFSGIQLQHIQEYCKRVCYQTWEFSGFLNAIWAIHIYVLVGVLLQFYEFDCSDSSCGFNYFWFGLWALVVIGVPLWVINTVYQNPNIKDDKYMKLKYSTLIDGLKLYSAKDPLLPRDSDHSPPQTNNLFPTTAQSEVSSPTATLSFRQKLIAQFSKYNIVILYIRKIVFCLIIAYLHKSSYSQLAIISILNAVVAFYYLFIQPFESKYENFKNAASEILLIIIQVLIISLVKDNSTNEDSRIKIGWIIVGLISFLIVWHFLGMTFDFMYIIFIHLKSLKDRRNRLKVANFDDQAGINEQYSPSSQVKKRLSNQQSKLGTFAFQNVEEQPGEDEDDENPLQSQRLQRKKMSTQIRREGSINNIETLIDNSNVSPDQSPKRRITSRQQSVSNFLTQNPSTVIQPQQAPNENGQESVYDIPFSNNQMIQPDAPKPGFTRFTKIRSIIES